MSDEAVEPVKRALRRLALGRDDPTPGVPPNGPLAGEGPPSADPERTVERAEAVVLDVRAAARFAADGGFADLERAVDAAESDGRVALADRGRAVLGTVAAYRTARADHVHRSRGAYGG